jgi:hypothetical protein
MTISRTASAGCNSGQPQEIQRAPPHCPADDAAELQAAAERLLGDRNAVSVAELLDEAGDWPTGRRLVAEMIAIHHHPELGFELHWRDGLRIDAESFPSWVSDGWFRRLAEVPR